MAALSMWAFQRDNGGCPGSAGSDSCSGIEHAPWAFSEVLNTPDAP
jgi:chitinase